MPCQDNRPGHNRHKGPRQAYYNHKKFEAYKYEDSKRPHESFLQVMTSLCCRRCASILRWKEEFAKYTPLEKPRKCNLCHQKQVAIAYHHICQQCARAHIKCAKCQLHPAKSQEMALLAVHRVHVESDDDDEAEEVEAEVEGDVEVDAEAASVAHPEGVKPEKVEDEFPFDDVASDESDEELVALRGLDVTRVRSYKRKLKKQAQADERAQMRERDRRTVVRKEERARAAAEESDSDEEL
jgi:hypothetical protein